MSLLAIAYPELTETDFHLIENFRKHTDTMFPVVRPHFTFIFPVNDFSIPDFSSEIKKQLEGITSISFCLRSSILNKDAFSENYHTFLVPDKGFREIVTLHDKLYSDQLSTHHRKDIKYIPHITVGNSTDKIICQQMTDDWNAKNFSINGVISSIDIIEFNNQQVTTLEKIELVQSN